MNQPALVDDPLAQGALHGEGGARRLRDRRHRRLRARRRARAVAHRCSAASCRTSSRSQTIPILAIAPMVVIWVEPEAARPLQGWGAVAVIAAYLTFFPVTINTLRGLQSADPRALELMRSYAASRWAVLWKLRVPASLPYIFSALKIAATASVVGAIIGELPSGAPGRPRRRDPQLQPVLLDRAAGAVGDEHRRGARSGSSSSSRSCSPRSSSSAARRSARRMNASQPVVSIDGVTKTFPRGNVTALAGHRPARSSRASSSR